MARLIDSVVGHRSNWSDLQSWRERQRVPHALAFVGSAGVGKKCVAWAFAQALVCEAADGESPCGQCPACARVANHQSESVLYIEPENALIKLEATQRVLSFLSLRRLGKARVIIIDEAQYLNPQAGNALLKSIEEPPEQTYFILLVSEFSQLLATLRSRLQVMRFSPLTSAEMRQLFREGEPPAEWMMHSARGSLAQLEVFRDADTQELRQLTLSFLQAAFRRQRDGLNALLDRSKERALALRCVQLLQQLLRDWSVLDNGELIHSDLTSALRELPALAAEQRVDLWRSALQMEQDLVAHVDRQLIFENFFHRASAG
jgi:DNA polymerase-3 subunit delta'